MHPELPIVVSSPPVSPLTPTRLRDFTAMLADAPAFHHLDELRNYVQQTICSHNGLVVGAFPMTERAFLRGSRRCGLLFCQRGPRSVEWTAVWDADRRTILFYGSAGERLQRTQLKDAPSLSSIDF